MSYVSLSFYNVGMKTFLHNFNVLKSSFNLTLLILLATALVLVYMSDTRNLRFYAGTSGIEIVLTNQ